VVRYCQSGKPEIYSAFNQLIRGGSAIQK